MAISEYYDWFNQIEQETKATLMAEEHEAYHKEQEARMKLARTLSDKKKKLLDEFIVMKLKYQDGEITTAEYDSCFAVWLSATEDIEASLRELK